MRNTKLVLTSEFATRKKIEVYESIFTHLPDPDKILQLNGYNYDIYRDLLNDAHLTSVIQQRKMQVIQMGWEVDNISDEEKKKEAIRIVSDLNLNKISSDILDAVLFGFVVAEIIWEFKDGKYIPIDIVTKPQEWFRFDKDNRIKIVDYSSKGSFGNYKSALRGRNGRYNGSFSNETYGEGGFEDLPPYKFILVQYNPKYDNPYGERLLRKVYWPVIFKRATIEKWHLLSEKFGIPFFLGYYNSNASEEEKDKILEQMEEAIKNNIALMEDGTKVEFKENPKYEIGQLFDNMVQLQNSEISKAILTVTLTTDVGRVGSYKAAEIHRDMLEFIGLSDKKLVETTINKMLEYYSEINYGTKDLMPRFRLKKKEKIIETTVERDEKLMRMGIKFKKEYYVKRYNLNEEEFEVEEEG